MDWVQRKRWEWLRIVGWLDPGCLDPCSREEEPGLLWGIFGGPCARGGTFSYFLAPPTFFGKSFLFESNVAKEGLPRDDPSGLGAGGPEFKSRRPDQNHLPYFLQLVKSGLHPKLHCGIPADRGTRSTSDSIVKTCRIRKIGQLRRQACKFPIGSNIVATLPVTSIRAFEGRCSKWASGAVAKLSIQICIYTTSPGELSFR
jgi:hypothetical protein